MKKTVLLSFLVLLVTSISIGQKKSKSLQAYAITAIEKGHSRWTEVRLVDIITGEEIRKVYESAKEAQRLNARTGKPIVIKEAAETAARKIAVHRSREKVTLTTTTGEVIVLREAQQAPAGTIRNAEEKQLEKRIYISRKSSRPEQPFATNSAACAYDKKHDRLYYTPMGINQLRYIDLKAKSPTVYYFEDEAFGVVEGSGDVPNQITRMVIASNGNGYALSNNGEHLIRFTTKKKPVITDLGQLTDDASNGKYSIHSPNGYGGDMVADASGNLVLITANRRVFKINPETRIATFKGLIKGLPAGFTTNGAAVDKGTNIIVTSSTVTSGYYSFDLKTLQAEKLSTGETVFNASDLANGNLLAATRDEKKNEEPIPAEEEQAIADVQAKQPVTLPMADAKLLVYPNPVTNGIVNLSFQGYDHGRYQLQLLDLSGKHINSQSITINSKSQVQDFRLPALLAKGTYLIKTLSEDGKLLHVEKLIVQ